MISLEPSIRSIDELVPWCAQQFGDHPALSRSRLVDKSQLSYRDLRLRVERGAAALWAGGLQRGARVVLYADPGPDWVAALFSILKAGAIGVPLPRATDPRALAGIIDHADARMMIVDDRMGGAMGRASIRTIELQDLFCHAGAAADCNAPSSDPSDVALLAYTSGSTRTPKAVKLTHTNLLADLNSLLQARRATTGDAFLSILPPAHLFELMAGILGPMACGARIVFPGRPLPNRLVASLREDGITHACCVPALLNLLHDELIGDLAMGGIAVNRDGLRPIEKTIRKLRAARGTPELDRLERGLRRRIGGRFGTVVVGGAALDPRGSKCYHCLTFEWRLAMG